MSPLCVLIIDDDADDRDMFCEAVSEINKEIVCNWAKNGIEAINVLSVNKQQPDFIFLDLNMPGISGKQCLTKLKSNENWADIPVYMYSTSKLDSDIKETRILGATGFITKPSTYKELKQSLLPILNKDT